MHESIEWRTVPDLAKKKTLITLTETTKNRPITPAKPMIVAFEYR